jgi:hypothetical protein
MSIAAGKVGRKLVPFAASALALSAYALASDQERSVNAQRPVQTELIAPLDAGRLHRGSPVFAKVKFDWDSPGCKLLNGSTVVGYIADLEQKSKQNKGSSLTIVFNKADCDGHVATPVDLIVFAVIAEVTIHDSSGMIDRDGLFGSNSPRGVASMGGGSAPVPPSYAPVNDVSVRNARKKAGPNVLLPGQVVGLNNVTLAVGTGTDGGSTLSSPNHNVRLESTTTSLVLMPKNSLFASKGTEPASHSDTVATANSTTPADEPVAKSSNEPVAPPPPPEPVDETEVCSSSCTIASDSGTLPSASASASLAAATLGYEPHEKRELTAFNHEAAITYLDASNLLFTFDLHKLRQRSGKSMRPESTRIVRAVLVDPATQTIKRIVDWQVQGDGEYLWRAGSDHVLVHVGHQLRLLAADLSTVRMIPVPGVLAWVSTSPSGDHFAVGVLHERHTPALHQQIYEATNVDPEEDIDVMVFDREFNQLFTAKQPSTMYPPVLADSGEIVVRPAGNNRWTISEMRWDGTRHQVAEITSRCHPTLSTPLSDRVFVVGCNSSPSINWYRLLRLDGHTILRDHGSSREIEQAAKSSTETQIAVRVARTYKSTIPGDAFHKTDLKEQEISVYDATDGHRLFTTVAADIAVSDQSFALSPNGHQIAVLHNNAIAFYSLGDNGTPPRPVSSYR